MLEVVFCLAPALPRTLGAQASSHALAALVPHPCLMTPWVVRPRFRRRLRRTCPWGVSGNSGLPLTPISKIQPIEPGLWFPRLFVCLLVPSYAGTYLFCNLRLDLAQNVARQPKNVFPMDNGLPWGVVQPLWSGATPLPLVAGSFASFEPVWHALVPIQLTPPVRPLAKPPCRLPDSQP